MNVVDAKSIFIDLLVSLIYPEIKVNIYRVDLKGEYHEKTY